jgi:hypothetical protein
MNYDSLVLSGILAVAAWFAARLPNYGVGITIALAGGVILSALGFFSGVAVLSALVLGVIGVGGLLGVAIGRGRKLVRQLCGFGLLLIMILIITSESFTLSHTIRLGILCVGAMVGVIYARKSELIGSFAVLGVLSGTTIVLTWLDRYRTDFPFSYAVLIQVGILCVGLLLAAMVARGRKCIRPLTILSLLIGYGSVAGYGAIKEREYAQRTEARRTEYPLKSLEERLPQNAPTAVGGNPTRLNQLEEEIKWESIATLRTQALKELHDGTVRRFEATPDFGRGRMLKIGPLEPHLPPEPRDAPLQPDYFSPSLKEPLQTSEHLDEKALDRLHEKGIVDFVNPRGFGFVKDRQHVAGFQSHSFSRIPDAGQSWKVVSLELVGLLRHEKPVVYLSTKLPRMDELSDKSVRQLDAFEMTALTELQRGADMHIGEDKDSGRFLGAIRSTKQCIECHGGERGALLGAFTYRLRPSR